MCGFGCGWCMFWFYNKVIFWMWSYNWIFKGMMTNFIQKFHVFLFFLFFFVVSVWAFCSIIHDNEFSTRLSVGSILRLRASAITALSENTQADTTLILRLARQFLYASKNNSIELEPEPAKSSTRSSKGEVFEWW